MVSCDFTAFKRIYFHKIDSHGLPEADLFIES